jgi:predicted nucleic acid-binding protein
VIVVDASVAVDILLQLDAAEVLMDSMFSETETLHAPQLMDIEVAQVIRRYWRAGDITAARGMQAIEDLQDLPITRYAHEPLLDRIWQLRANATAYDAAYLALAEALGAVVLTRDKALARVPGVKVVVEVV